MTKTSAPSMTVTVKLPENPFNVVLAAQAYIHIGDNQPIYLLRERYAALREAVLACEAWAQGEK